MPIRSSAVGSRLDSHDSDVSVRQALAYAAGIGATGDSYFDDDRETGVVAPPSFCVSLEWPVVSGERQVELLGATLEERRRGVHAAQDSTFHRPIRPGDRLRTDGRIVALRSTRAGTLCLTRLETIDRASDAAVATSWSTSIFRSVDLEGGDQTLAAPPGVERLSSIDGFEQLEISIDRQLPHVYSECADIWNPIHTERSVALAAGLPDIILHGTASWALAGREIVERYCDGDPTRLRRLYGSFRAMVVPGWPITLVHRRLGDGRVRFVVRNHVGEAAVADGLAEVA
jgi:acyl dehydratase